MKSLHIWMSVMLFLSVSALIFLIFLASCSYDRENRTAGETQTDAVESKDDTSSETAPETESHPASETETCIESATESVSETQSECDTETVSMSETTHEISASGLKFVTNADGTCYLAGVGTCSDACIFIPEYVDGRRVVAIAPSAFYGCQSISAIQIPTGVLEIGDLAFANCPNLTYISVRAGNPSYCDKGGVLYSADGTTLILYPASRAGTTVTISAAVRQISAMAFYNCRFLQTVYYGGTDAQWEQVRIASGNYSLTAASVHTSADGK